MRENIITEIVGKMSGLRHHLVASATSASDILSPTSQVRERRKEFHAEKRLRMSLLPLSWWRDRIIF